MDMSIIVIVVVVSALMVAMAVMTCREVAK
jgi:hypothetical protein